VLPCVPRLQTRLPTREGFSAIMCPTVSDPASLLGRALALPCVPQLRTHFPAEDGSDPAMCPMVLDLPPCWGGLQCCNMSHGSRPASLLGRAPVLPRASSIKEVTAGSAVHLRLAHSQGTHARKFPRRTRMQVPKVVLQWSVKGACT
jgi:hypothetical protein